MNTEENKIEASPIVNFEDKEYKINSSKKIEYKFHWSNRFLNNILNK